MIASFNRPRSACDARAANGTVRITGQLSPAEQGQRVGVTLAGPAGAERVADATTNAQGRFAASLSAANPQWTAQASRLGDRFYAGAESTPCRP